jgi:uncharacterized membrane protein YfcA
MDLNFLILFLLLGMFTGVFAGLFGIGGGGIMVPVLSYLFIKMQFPQAHLLHLALGTSMAAIVPTAIASLRAHQHRGAVLWPVVFKMAPGVLLGTFAGTFLSSYLSAKPLAIFFVCFMGFVAVQMFLDRKPQPARQIPGLLALLGVGSGIGAVSSLVAIGGGTLTVPLLTWCNVRLPVAIGTSAAVGLPIACAGALGYGFNGWSLHGLPLHTLGFIYWPAVMLMAFASLITAPVGVRLVHSLPLGLLKKCFALLLMMLSLNMLIRVLGL